MIITPLRNKILFGLYVLATLGVFAAALIFPSFRALAFAPLRDLILPRPAPIEVLVLYSTEKEGWIQEAITRFEKTNTLFNGHPIEITLSASGSREMYLDILDGQAQPDLVSPASMLQIALLQDLSAQRSDKFQRPVVNRNDTQSCHPVLSTPLVLVAWRERAEVLWGSNPNGTMWLRLHEAVTAQTWETYAHPEWGYIKFGQTNPLKSNSGFQTMVLMAYNYFQKTSGLSNNDVLNPEYQEWYRQFGRDIVNLGDSTGTFMKEIVAYGPSQYDIVAVYEATAIEQIDNAIARYGDEYGGLRIYYPPATLLSEHPFCVMQADWVTPEKAAAAQLFLDFLSGPEMQALALEYGFRPVDSSIPLDSASSPFVRYSANGVKVDLPAAVELPSGNVLDTLLTFWQREINQ